MYIATVIPIKKGLHMEHLTYFSIHDIPLGSIVTVQVRSKSIDAIVISLEDAHKVKSDLKQADYQLKKVLAVKGSSPFSKEFFGACYRMKDYTASTTGDVIRSMLPKILLECVQDLKIHRSIEIKTKQENIEHEKLIFQALTPDRVSWYRTLIRESFAKKESVFICVPTRYDIEIYTKELTKGIEQYVATFHGDMTKKALVTLYNSVIDNPHPLLIIGTGMFLSIPRHDIKTIIVEHESSDAYKQIARPYIDVRSFAEVFSSITKSKLIFGDTLLRPDTLHRHEKGVLGEVSSPLFRLPNVERKLVVDMKEEVNEKGDKKFTVLSETTKSMITHALSHDESVFLFSVRKGLAGVTVCNDCGHTLLCPLCKTPVVLYSAKKKADLNNNSERIFMCNKCGHKDTTEVRCPECTSWNLTPLGVGTDRVFDEVQNLFKNANVIQIDKETTSTDKEARAAIKEFNKKKGSILVGTEMAFSYLDNQVTHSAIISLDGLLSVPSFNITQKILHVIEKLHYITERNLIIQTRIPENQILTYILSGNVLPLYREDLKEREQFGYPPFKRLIKITFTGTASETTKARSYLDHILADYDPQIFSAFTGRIKGSYVTNTVIKVDPKIWPLPTGIEYAINPTLLENLSNLPPSFSVNVDPEDLL